MSCAYVSPRNRIVERSYRVTGNCAAVTNRAKSARTSTHRRPMVDDLDQSQQERPMRGNSREYLLQRLERDGFTELVEAIERGELSTYAAAVEVGYRKRPEPTGRGSENERRRREWAIRKAFQTGERADAVCARPAPSNGPSIPDLAAAIAEWEEAQRAEPRTHATTPIPTPAPPAPTLPEPFPICSEIPCTSCSHPAALTALREVLGVYMASRRGRASPGSTLPRACCQRQIQHVEVEALIA